MTHLITDVGTINVWMDYKVGGSVCFHLKLSYNFTKSMSVTNYYHTLQHGCCEIMNFEMMFYGFFSCLRLCFYHWMFCLSYYTKAWL